MLDEKEIENNAERIKELLRSTGREGIENVIDYLEKHHFFNSPSSESRHHNWRGGLAQHSLGIFDRLQETGKSLPWDSIILTALLHDICKAGLLFYDEKGNLKKRDPKGLHIPGHGDRSVKLLEKCGLDLRPEEKDAIRWHMGGYNLDKKYIRDFFRVKKSDLWRLLYNADRYDASHNGR